MHRLSKLFTGLIALMLMLAGAPAFADNVGWWSGSARTINDPDFLASKANLQTMGVTFAPDGGITASYLGGLCIFVDQEPGKAPSKSEMALLLPWISAGNTFMLVADSGGTGVSAINDTLAALSVPMSLSIGLSTPGMIANTALSTTPFNLTGLSLTTSPATIVTGGTAISFSYIHAYMGLGTGLVIVAGDPWFHPAIGGANPLSVNSQLFVDICSASGCKSDGGGGGHPPAIPEGSTFGMAGISVLLGAIGMAATKKKKRH